MIIMKFCLEGNYLEEFYIVDGAIKRIYGLYFE